MFFPRIRFLELGARAATTCLVFVPLLLWAQAESFQPIPAVVHVHSDLSTGDYSLLELAREAKRKGVEALFVSENYLLRFEYSLPPFRALTHLAYEKPSVFKTGLPSYLSRVAEVQREVPGVLVLPGVEVIPHYYWTGSPWGGKMELHNTQKNVLVFGLHNLTEWRSLPSTGNPYARRLGWGSLLDFAPVLLMVPGVILLRKPRRRRRRVGLGVVVLYQRNWLRGGILCGLAAIALVRSWPFGRDSYPPYRDFGLEPYQALIDYVERLGGATMWSFPETSDSGKQRFGPVEISWRTDPYAEDLIGTSRYTGYGAVYEDTTHFEEPGGGWDRLLAGYMAGKRGSPSWALGESGYHGPEAHKELQSVQTVFFAKEKSQAGLLEALKSGRMYALRRSSDKGLRLLEFAVRDGDVTAAMGETHRVRKGSICEIRVGIDASDGSSLPIQVTLVRNGKAIGVWPADTPLRITHQEAFDGEPAFFRVAARGSGPHVLVTNPIFLQPSAE